MKRVSSLAIFGVLALLGCGVATQPSGAPSKSSPAATPEAVFSAYLTSIDRGDWPGAYNCLTPAAQNAEVFGIYMELAMFDSDLLKRHQDAKRLKQLEKEPSPESVEDLREMMVGLLIDKRAFYLEASAFFAKDRRRLAPRGPLKHVHVSGDRARGIATDRTFGSKGDGPLVGTPYPSPIYFARSGSRWLIDVPTAQEQQQDAQRPELFEPGPAEAYHHCPRCGSLQGGICEEEQFKKYSGEGREACDHQWTEITRERFKELATEQFNMRWNDEPDPFGKW